MTDAPFLAAILENPTEDGPRLVYADWLDERGDPRGEFVRVQCELAKVGAAGETCWASNGAHCGCHTCALRRRERELWEVMWPLLWSILQPILPSGTTILDRRATKLDCSGGVILTVRRGFVEEVVWAAADFLRHADTLRAATPLRKWVATTMPEAEMDDRLFSTRQAWLRERPHQSFLHRTLVHRQADIDRYGGNGALALALLRAQFPGLEVELPTERVTVSDAGPAGAWLMTTEPS